MIDLKSPNEPGKGQLRCPKCGAMRFNVDASDLARVNGRVTCSHCGQERVVKEFRFSVVSETNKGLDMERFK